MCSKYFLIFFILDLISLNQLVLNFRITHCLIFTIRIWLIGRTARWRWSSWVRWKKPSRLLSTSTTTTWEKTTICECPSPNPPSSTPFTTNTLSPSSPYQPFYLQQSDCFVQRIRLTDKLKKKRHYRYSWGSFRDLHKKKKKEKKQIRDYRRTFRQSESEFVLLSRNQGWRHMGYPW